MNRLYMLMTITNRVAARKDFLEFYRENGAPEVFTGLGRGTASDDILSTLGLEATEKAVMFSVVTPETRRFLKDALVSTMKINTPGRGIALTFPLSSVGGKTAANYLISGTPEDVEVPDVDKEEESMENAPYQLIVAIANRGQSSLVMEAAHSVGARGGTILHVKDSGSKETKFFGMSIAEEREMILIVAAQEQKNEIMQAIMAKAGLQTKAQAVTFSIELADVMGLHQMNEEA